MHAIRAITNLEFIEVQIGTELVEEDIIRLFMTGKRLKDSEYEREPHYRQSGEQDCGEKGGGKK